MLHSVIYEQNINYFLEQVHAELAHQGLATDMSVFVSLLGADQVVFRTPTNLGMAYSKLTFDRGAILRPDVLISSDVSCGLGMRPVYDMICQSVGLEGSGNYDGNGEWKDPAS